MTPASSSPLYLQITILPYWHEKAVLINYLLVETAPGLKPEAFHGIFGAIAD
jgi:hypothetical protein